MTAPAVTYTFVNSTTADADQVNQNFTDIINALTDQTKSFSIDALTMAGNLQVDGNVTLGSSGGDDVSFGGSLASSIAIKTTASYNIGAATFGLLSIYFGRNSQTTRLIGSASMSATWTLTLPVNAGTNRLGLITDGSGTTSWHPVEGPTARNNYGITATVGSSALTISLKGADGNDPSTTNPVSVGFRSATLTSGSPAMRTATAATSIVVPSTATLGTTNGVASNVYVYAIDNAGTIELAVTLARQGDEGALISTTAIDTASDVATTIYSTTARTNVAFRFLGIVTSTQATAGTWATSPSSLRLYEAGGFTAPSVTIYTSGSSTYTTPSGALYLEIEMVGGGGGGGGSGTGGDGGTGNTGGNTTFGDATAAAGTGGQCANGASGAGGTATIGTGTGQAIAGSGGGGGVNNSGGQAPGGMGGGTPLGGGGGTTANNTGQSAVDGTGGGGGGGGGATTNGAGGGSGGYIHKYILSSLAATYAYGVGAGGTGGSAGSAGAAGGDGGDGIIIVKAYFQ